MQPGSILGMPERGGDNGGGMLADEPQITTDKLTPAIKQ